MTNEQTVLGTGGKVDFLWIIDCDLFTNFSAEESFQGDAVVL